MVLKTNRNWIPVVGTITFKLKAHYNKTLGSIMYIKTNKN